MMMPSLSTSSSSSSSSVTTRVDKATSELLVAPDWTMNIEICDICNSNHWLAKDAVKSLKRRLQHKSPKVQLLALTLLETMVKNCGEYIHYNLAERKIVDEMIKIVKKKTDIHVRDKILVLLDSWQEAFGGPAGKYTQYYWACDELRRSGIQFPYRSPHSAPVVTPPATHRPEVASVGFGMPTNSSRRLDEAMTSEVEGLSSSTLESMGNVMGLLDDMLQAVNPNDRMAVKDEVIVDLIDRCRANQKKLLQMIINTTDEELLVKGIEINDSLQFVLAKHDAITSGAPLPLPLPNTGSSLNVQPIESASSSLETGEARDKNLPPDDKTPASVAEDQGEEEEEDEFAQLARRHTKGQSTPLQSTATGATEDTASSSSSNALVVVDIPAPEPVATNTTKEQDFIDLLSIVLSTDSSTSETPQAPSSAPAETTVQASLNSYVVPWAQPQPQPQSQSQYQSMQSQVQVQQGYSQNSSSYPPPPWEATSAHTNQYPRSNPYVHQVSQGSINGSNPPQGASPSQNMNSFENTQYGSQLHSSGQKGFNFSSPVQGTQRLQPMNSFQNPAVDGSFYSTTQSTMPPPPKPMQGVPGRTSNNGSAMNGNTLVTNGSGVVPSGQKPYVPSYKLFEDLNVFGSSESKIKSGPYPSASGNPSQNVVAGRR